jgi:ribonuclease HI
MELYAVIAALSVLKEPCLVFLSSDSQYVLKGITEWVQGWEKKGWKTANGKPVKNQTLWRTLIEQSSRHHITWQWVRGHSGHEFNERVDELARIEAQSFV